MPDLTIQDVFLKYCDFSEESGFVLKPDAPKQAAEIYRAVTDPQPDGNGIVTEYGIISERD